MKTATKRKSTVEWDDKHKCFDLLDSGRIGYFIEMAWCTDHASILHWVRHISAKTWCTTYTIVDLLDAIEEKTGIAIYVST